MVDATPDEPGTPADLPPPLRQLQASIDALQAQRSLLGDAVVDTAVAGLRMQLQARTEAQAPAPQPAAPSTTNAPAPGATPTQALRLVSILFLDVVGSTALGQALDPEDIHAVMDGALQRLTDVVQAHGGRVLQYAGDNLLAGFGTREVHEDDAERAVRCGLALLAEGRRLGREVQAAHGHAGFDLRVGIHSGSVLLGGGVDAEGTIRGSAVNIAARMEQSAPPGSLQISIDTYRLVQGRFDVQPSQTIPVKGLAAPMSTYRVDRERARPAQALRHGVDGLRSPLVGRGPDLAQLQQALAQACSGGRLQAITLIGDAGLGKSRLLAELEQTVAVAAGAPGLLRAAGHAQGLRQPYGLVRDLLFRRCDVQDSDGQARAQAKLAAGLAPVFGHRAEEQTALLGQLIGLDYRASPVIAGILEDGRQLRARAFHALVEYLRGLCRQAPQVLLLDDLHWADDGSLDALAHLARAGADLPLLLLCAARPELLQRRARWGADWPAHQALSLQPLAADDRLALARALLPQTDGDAPALQQLLVDRTDGNPFYMEAMLQMLVDNGVLLTSSRPWTLAAGGLQRLMQVPTTLVGVLQARLDALQPVERRALQQASVVGTVFWDQALAALDPAAPAALPALCERALALPSDHSTFDDAREFSFRHHLLHKVTYGTVLKPDKRAHHHRAAQWLQARSAGRGAEMAGQIAEHFERAGQPAQAAGHWAQAAQEAVDRHADDAALAHADRALAAGAGDDLRRRFAMQRVRASVLLRRGDVAAQLQALAEQDAVADTLDDDVLRLIAAQGHMLRLCLSGQFDQAHAIGVERLARAETLAPAEAARVHNTLLMALGRQGRHAEAGVHAAKALAQARSAGDTYTEASVLNNLAAGCLAQRRLHEAQRYLAQALAIYQRSGSRYGAAIALLNLALAAELSGQMAQARDQLQALLTLCDDIGHRSIAALGRCNLSFLLVELGDPAAGLDSARDGIRRAEAEGDQFTQTVGQGAAFVACYRLGRWAEAVAHGRQAQAGYRVQGQPETAEAYQAGVAMAQQRWGSTAAARDAAGAVDAMQAMAATEAIEAVEAVLAAVAARGGWQEAAESATYCYQVLQTRQDPRAAAVLAAAIDAQRAQISHLTEPAERSRFLQATSLRRQLLAACATHGLAGPA